MSVMVCIPTADDIRSETTEAAFRLCALHPGGAEFRSVRAQPTDHARNLCVKLFLESNHDHLFFLDSDVVPPDDALRRLLAADRPIACGVYPLLLRESTICTSVALRDAPNTYTFLTRLPGAPFDADAAGMGCCLISRHVLSRLPFPWFRFTQHTDCTLIGEDIYFFEKAETIGCKPRILHDLHCSHLKAVDLLDVIRIAWQRREQAPAGAV